MAAQGPEASSPSRERGPVRSFISQHTGLIGTIISLLVVFGLLTHGRYGSIPLACDICHWHSPGTNCASCHKTQGEEWASREDMHSASAAVILGNAEHNSAEVPKDDCLVCHSMFQAVSLHAVVDASGTVPGSKIPTSAYGPEDDPEATFYQNAISHFIQPVNATGPWKVINRVDWQATKCEVCHDVRLKSDDRVSKYGAWLDNQPKAAYIPLNEGMPTAYQYVFKDNAYVKTDYTRTNRTSVRDTKLCDSCHDPDDQGSEDATTIAGRNYGPQGGDARSYVTTNHAGFGCTDCHRPHLFASEDDTAAAGDSKCNGPRCHTTPAKLAQQGDPGVVHTNHIPVAEDGD